MWKWIAGLAVLLVLLIAVGGWAFVRFGPGKPMLERMRGVERPTEVRLEPVERGELIRVVSAPGRVEPVAAVEITAQVSARIIALPFREGQQVRKGDVVVRLDAEELLAALEAQRAAVKADEARLEGNRASLEQARRDLERIRQLRESDVRSAAELESAEAAFAQSSAALRVAEHAIEIARANLRRAERDVQNCVIASPIDGTITLLSKEVGELVLGTFNNVGQTIMRIGDLSTMAMKAEVDESSVASVRPGQRARVYINAYPGREFAGVVEQVRRQRELSREGKGYFETQIKLELSPGEQLMSGLTANADVQVETQQDVLKVPSQAVLDRRMDELPDEARAGIDPTQRNKSFTRVVFVAREGKARAVPVVTGTSDLTSTVVLSGLSDGDAVVAGPYKVLASLKDGQAIQQIKAATPSEGGEPAAPSESETAARRAPDKPRPIGER